MMVPVMITLLWEVCRLPVIDQPPVLSPDHSEFGREAALIEEARRRARRRRWRNGAVVGALLGVAALFAVGHGRGGATNGTPAAAANRPVGIHVEPAAGLMANGPLMLIRQDEFHGGVYVVGRAGLGVRALTCGGCVELQDIAWSPDGSQIALGEDSVALESPVDGIHVRDIATGRDRFVVGRDGTADLAWSPDGSWLAYSGGTNGMNRATGRIYFRQGRWITTQRVDDGHSGCGHVSYLVSRWHARGLPERSVDLLFIGLDGTGQAPARTASASPACVATGNHDRLSHALWNPARSHRPEPAAPHTPTACVDTSSASPANRSGHPTGARSLSSLTGRTAQPKARTC